MRFEQVTPFRKIIRQFGTVVFVLMSLVLIPRGAMAGDGAANMVASRVMMAFEKEQSKVLSNVLYYPSHYAQDELQANQQAIALLFGFFFKQAGDVSDVKPCKQQPTLERFWFDGGDKADWVSLEKPKATTEVCFRAHFSRLGDGYVVVSLLQIVDNGQANWYPYRIAYGEPKDSAADKAKVEKLAKAAAAFIREQLGGH